MYKPYEVVDFFEKEIAEYVGSKYGIAIESCSAALFLCLKYQWQKWECLADITIPKHTYFSVPCAIIHAGGKVLFDNRKWSGCYQLKPYKIWDSALRFKRGMYIKDSYYCLSFHAKKHLPIGRGGMILCDDKYAVEWFRKARIDGRNPKDMADDIPDMVGYNMYLTPEQAARGLWLFEAIKNKNLPDIKNEYPDLSKMKIYQC